MSAPQATDHRQADAALAEVYVLLIDIARRHRESQQPAEGNEEQPNDEAA